MSQDYTGSQVVSHAFNMLSRIASESGYNIADDLAKAIKENFYNFPEVLEFLKFGGY